MHLQVVRETGPPHMRTFVTKCVVGDIVTEGEGNGKKVSTEDDEDVDVEDGYDDQGCESQRMTIIILMRILILSKNVLFITLSLEVIGRSVYICNLHVGSFVLLSSRKLKNLLQVSKKKAAELMLDQLRQVGAMVVSIKFYFFTFNFYILNS